MLACIFVDRKICRCNQFTVIKNWLKTIILDLEYLYIFFINSVWNTKPVFCPLVLFMTFAWALCGIGGQESESFIRCVFLVRTQYIMIPAIVLNGTYYRLWFITLIACHQGTRHIQSLLVNKAFSCFSLIRPLTWRFKQTTAQKRCLL